MISSVSKKHAYIFIIVKYRKNYLLWLYFAEPYNFKQFFNICI